ncbi:MAG: chromate resistance protein ChrB domain-containing protein [Pseudomonadota bacterium]
MHSLILILSLPTDNATIRMRAWRALKAAGAVVLRDGVYLLPERGPCRETLETIANDVVSGGGKAQVLRVENPADDSFTALFDRTAEFSTLLAEVTALRRTLTARTATESVRQLRKLRKSASSLGDIDFFPGEAQQQVQRALAELETMINALVSPGEPHPSEGAIATLSIADYQGRRWATRRRPWVDRLASAWLIRRFIDPQAQFLWLNSPADCPPDALGFDFDGATFTHVGALVSFEVLLRSFALDTPSLKRLATLVHYLDVGGVSPAEAGGVESVLSGLRNSIQNDDQLLDAAATIFDALLTHFASDESAHDSA